MQRYIFLNEKEEETLTQMLTKSVYYSRHFILNKNVFYFEEPNTCLEFQRVIMYLIVSFL